MELDERMQLQGKALADPSRFRLLQYIARSAGPVGVKELTELLGFNHNAIRQHLVVLVESELVHEQDEVRTTRGRPRKLYLLRHDALDSFSSVGGAYERLSELLLAIASSGSNAYDVGFAAAAGDVIDDRDLTVDQVVAGLLDSLAVGGFRPVERRARVITLQHCPFASVAQKDPGIVCELHRGLIDGQLASVSAGVEGELVVRDPRRAGCVVSISSKDS